MSFSYGLDFFNYKPRSVRPRYPRRPYSSNRYGSRSYGNTSSLIKLIHLLLSRRSSGYSKPRYQPNYDYQPQPQYDPQPYLPFPNHPPVDYNFPKPKPKPVYDDPVHVTYEGPTHRVWGDPHYEIKGKKYDFQGQAGKTYSVFNDKVFALSSTHNKWGDKGATVNGIQYFQFQGLDGKAVQFAYNPITDKLSQNGEDITGKKVEVVTAALKGNAPVKAIIDNTKKGSVNIQGPTHQLEIKDMGDYVNHENIRISNLGTGLDGNGDTGLAGILFNPGFTKLEGNNANLRFFLGDKVIDPNTAFLLNDTWANPQNGLFGTPIGQGEVELGLNAGQGGDITEPAA